MIPKKLIYLFTGVLILSLAACSTLKVEIPFTGGDQTTEVKSSLANSHWRLISYGEPGSEIQVTDGTDITLQFEDGNMAGGSGGCNTFGAQYEVSGDNILSITKIVSTEMACGEASLMEQEMQYFDALKSVESFELSGNVLTVWYGDGQAVLNFARITSKIPNSVYL